MYPLKLQGGIFVSFFNTVRELVKAGRISQQSAYLAQLIDAGVRTKEELAGEVGKSVRTVERQLKELYSVGVIESVEGLLITATKLSVDQINISIYNNIDTIDENVVSITARLLSSSPQRIRQAIRNARVDDPAMIEEAARIAIMRKPRSLVGYFCAVLRNMRNAITETVEDVAFVWEDICEQVKPLLGKASYNNLFLKAKCVKKSGKLYIQGATASTLWHLYSDLLQSFGISGLLAGNTLQKAI
jgi:transcriptional regulator with XRE-family HTH domain